MEESRVACAICHVKASKVRNPDGREWWGHPTRTGHKVVPVELEPRDIIRVCDFCLEQRPRWVIPLMEHATTSKFEPDIGFHVTALDMDGWWMACDACVELVSSGGKKGLRDRALAALRQNLPDFTEHEKQSTLLQLAAFWAGQPGPAVEASILDD